MLVYKRFLLLAMVIMVTLCAACTEVERDSYRTLVIAANTYDATMSAVATAHADGAISTEQYEKVKVVASVYHGTFHTARLALESYVSLSENGTASTSDQETLLATLSTMTTRLAELSAYVYEIGVNVSALTE
ncbi:MAG: hypothetical protein R3Y11_00495 [Pseudomonadota bacterium]